MKIAKNTKYNYKTLLGISLRKRYDVNGVKFPCALVLKASLFQKTDLCGEGHVSLFRIEVP